MTLPSHTQFRYVYIEKQSPYLDRLFFSSSQPFAYFFCLTEFIYVICYVFKFQIKDYFVLVLFIKSNGQARESVHCLLC